WNDIAAYDVAGRIWMNFSLPLRGADHFGLPRFILSGFLGGQQGSEADRHFVWAKFFRNAPRLLRVAYLALKLTWNAERVFAPLDARISTARGLRELHRTSVFALDRLIETALAVGGMLFLITPLRRRLGLPAGARLVTQEMMQEYEKLAQLPSQT